MDDIFERAGKIDKDGFKTAIEIVQEENDEAMDAFSRQCKHLKLVVLICNARKLHRLNAQCFSSWEDHRNDNGSECRPYFMIAGDAPLHDDFYQDQCCTS